MWQSTFCRLLSHSLHISVFSLFHAMSCKKNLFSNLAKYLKIQSKNKLSFSIFSRDYLSTRSLIPRRCLFRCQTEINDFKSNLTSYKYPNRCLENRKNFSNFTEKKCWKCKQDLVLNKFSCSVCGALQYPKQQLNYFELLGVSQMYDINYEDLSTKFRNLQKKFHPDIFANKSKEEQEISEIYSRLINKAYATLKDPLARGFYLLRLQNIPVNEYMSVEQNYLTEIMEKNEELEGIKNKICLKKFSETNLNEIDKQIKMISEAFLHRRWEEAKIHLVKLNYLTNLDKKVKEKDIEWK